MADKPSRSTIGDYVTLQRGTTYRSRLLGMPGPVLLGLATIQRNGGFRWNSLRTYGGDSPDKLLVQPGELYVSLKDVTQSADLLGAVARLPRDHPPGRLTQDTVKLESRERDAPLDYLYWLLRTPQYRGYCRSHATGTTNLGLAREDFLAFPVPELTRARLRIVDTLTTLDDKIELNRRMNVTLEAMARALFKSWFVDFEPVRAKAEGRDPGLPRPLADLFPDSFEDSELGEIPRGWRAQLVRDIGTIVCGKTPPTQVSEYYGHDVPFITIPDMHGRVFATSVQKRLSHAGAQSQEKKLLPAGTICVSCIATAGLVVITSELSQTNQQINSVVPNQRDATYFWYWTLRNLGDEIRAGGSGGSVLTNLSTGRFGELRVLAGVAELRSCYHAIAAPVFGRILENEHESRSLATLRDTVLPKLISGELRVKDAERFRGRCA